MVRRPDERAEEPVVHRGVGAVFVGGVGNGSAPEQPLSNSLNFMSVQHLSDWILFHGCTYKCSCSVFRQSRYLDSSGNCSVVSVKILALAGLRRLSPNFHDFARCISLPP